MWRNVCIQNVRPLNPGLPNMVGPAYTLRYIPGREDLDKPPTPADPPFQSTQQLDWEASIDAAGTLDMDITNTFHGDLEAAARHYQAFLATEPPLTT